MDHLAQVSRHFTPATLQKELQKLKHNGLDILAVHLKPAYREEVIADLEALALPNLRIMEPGKSYSW
jgi:hypothetical protein